MVRCYIGIGSNMGDRRAYIASAIDALGKTLGIEVTRTSSIYETAPVSDIPQGMFLNGVLELETDIGARELLQRLMEIEEAFGRIRDRKNGPRKIDLDILYYGDEIINEDDLIIPHPRIAEREFVLKGLRELKKA